jgi:hypothetical protein
MSFRGGEFSAGTTGNFQSELTLFAGEWIEVRIFVKFISAFDGGAHYAATRPFADTSANAFTDFNGIRQSVLLIFLCWRTPRRTRLRTFQAEIDSSSAARAVVTRSGSRVGTAGTGTAG